MTAVRGIYRNILLCVAALPVCALAQSEVHHYMLDDFQLQVGAFFPQLNLDLGVDGSLTGEHPPLDFEGSAGTETDVNIFAVELIWRFGKQWSFRGQHFASSRNAMKVLQQDVEWGDTIFERGSSIAVGANMQITRFFFARDFSKAPQHEFGIGLGFHRMAFSASLAGNLVVNGQSFADETRAVSAVAPLPNLGGWYAYSPSEKWVFDVRLDWLDASIGDFSGALINTAAGANYQVFEHIGIGLKIQRFSLKFDVDKSDWRGRLKTSYEGLYVYLSGNWG